jgi:glutathione S-transferase
MPQNLRLWTFRTSPYSGKARAAFAEKGVDVQLIEIHPAKRPARLREINPANRVPVLQVDDTPIRESSLICEWLEETHPDPPLWPADATLRGWARGWAKYIDDTVTADFFVGMRKLAFGLDPDDPEDIVERLHGRIPRRWIVLEETLKEHDGPWLCGADFTFADLSALAVAVRIPEWGPHVAPDADGQPRVTAWLEALRARPSAAAIDTKGEPAAA